VLALNFLAFCAPIRRSERAENQAPTPIGCHLFKERYCYFFATACSLFAASRSTRGAHFTELFQTVKQIQKIYFKLISESPRCQNHNCATTDLLFTTPRLPKQQRGEIMDKNSEGVKSCLRKSLRGAQVRSGSLIYATRRSSTVRESHFFCVTIAPTF
jgi:hypothetical protein